MSVAEVFPVRDAVGCVDCQRMRRHIETLGRLRFELQHQVNVLDCRLRAAEARAAELERELRRTTRSSELDGGTTWNPR